MKILDMQGADKSEHAPSETGALSYQIPYDKHETHTATSGCINMFLLYSIFFL